ncbi:SMI1/KNR4 family protein [Nonomuraea sp. NPDC049141]|uniref:SMI1/KNR4 family protein n=1 Tax=Nonomuraea sp. NPDC049141 TaxID=3155500 RepID=UPI0033D143A5
MDRVFSALEQLIAVVPPPPVPAFGTDEWNDVFSDFGLRLPADYVAFIERYGRCEFARWLSVHDPRALPKEYRVQAAHWGDDYRDLREDFPEYHPLAMWPEPGGFFPWGSTIDGDEIGWLTIGEPEEWPCIVVPRHADQEPPIQETMTEWLVGWASGTRFDGSGFAEGAESHPLECRIWT